MKMQRVLIFTFLCCFLVAACTKKNEENGKAIFRYNESAGILTLDPAFAKDLPHIWACNQLYNSLLSFNEKMELQPALAKTFHISEDGLTYVFEIRQDVYFHDHAAFGNTKRKLTANDAAFSLRRLGDPTLSSPGAWLLTFVEKNEDGLAINAINDSVLIVKLSKAFPPFAGLMAMTYTSVVPREIVELYGDNFRTNPVGSGPFKFKYWKEGVKLVMVKNDNYFEKDEESNALPKIDGVAVSFLIDKQIAFMEFMKGNFDFMSGIDARYKDELLTRSGALKERHKGKIELVRQAFLNTEYLGFFIGDQKKELSELQHRQLRQAASMAIDRKKMLRYLRNNIGKAGNGGMIPFGLPGHDTDGNIGYHYQPEKARRILRENELSGTIVTISTTAEYVDLVKFVQSQWQAIGIDARIEVLPAATLRELRAHGKLECFRASWVADYPDAENYLSLFYSPNFTPSGPNYTHFKNEYFDRRYLEAMTETDFGKRASMYYIMDSIVMSEAPVVVLFYDEVLRFAHCWIKGLQGNPSNLLDLRNITIEKNSNQVQNKKQAKEF